ncbi:MAG TPA: hypothetical protein VJ814_00960 [Gaiellaceae bacterium]|nr:hypothetical protein [Gaiellaceae bacterium]
MRLAAAALAALAVAGGGGFALASALGAGPSGKASALARHAAVATTDASTEPAPAPASGSRPLPARLLGPGVPVPISPSLLRATNGWLASDGRTLVAVYAGAGGDDPAVGRVVIVRQDLVAGTQTVQTVDTGPTGALTIVAAEKGAVRLRAAGGGLLALDLGNNEISHDAHGPPLP